MTVPAQVIHDDSSGCIERHDLTSLSPEKQNEFILSRAAAEVTSDFDSLPLFRCELLQLSSDDVVMLLGAPSICADLRSLEMIVSQIATCYGSEEVPLATMQYADFAEWHHELLEGKEGEPGTQYWKSRALHTEVKIPFESPLAEETPFQPETLQLRVTPESGSAGEQFSHLALACWQVLIQRLNASSPVTIGKAFDGRRHPELASSVGLYTRYVPLAVEFVDEQLTIAQLLERLAHAEKEAFQWQEYFAWAETKPAYFSVCFEERRSASTFRAGDIGFSIYQANATDDRFDLKLVSITDEVAPRLELHYDAHRYASEDIRRLGDELITLIADANDKPRAAIADLESLSGNARLHILKDFNQTTQHDYPITCVHKVFEAQAQETPNVTAVVCGSDQVTYAELNQRANQLARRLQKLGVGPDVPVALCLERSIDFVTGMLGTLKAGGAYVPLDVNAPAERLATMLSTTKAALLLTRRRHGKTFPAVCPVLFLDDLGAELVKEDTHDCASNVTPENLAYVIFTSGSTGVPKGVAVEHRQLCNYVNAVDDRISLSACRSFAIVSTAAADLAHTMLFPSLMHGGTLHLISEDIAASPEMLADYFSRNRIDCLKIVPTHLSALLSSSRAADILPRRHLILGGEATSPGLLERISELSSDVAVWNHYGPTEATVGCVAQQLDYSPVITIGTPLANNTIYILDQRMRPVSIGVPGELYVGGAGVARGYINQPDLTAERFVPNPFCEFCGCRLYRTGDLARYLSNGRIELLGRVDHQIKVRGYRIEPGEIQLALNAHPLVSQSVVVVREDRPGDRRLVGYVVAKSPEIQDLRKFLGERLPDYMVPSTFVLLEALPLTRNGKVDRQALPAPEALVQRSVAPRNSVEQELSQIWGSVLGVPNPGVHENFFELGGDSILGIQIIAKANQVGMNLAPRQIFQHQTIAELAAVATDGLRPEAEQGIVTGEAPLTPVQARFFELNLPEPHHYNQARFLKLLKPVHSRSLQAAVERLLRHHDALRLRFVPSGKTWKQINSEPESVTPFECIDISHCDETEIAQTLNREAARLHTSLNLQTGPIIRVALFDGADKTESYLLIVIHHLAVDEVSWGVLLEDLETAYRQVAAGEEVSLPRKTTSFKSWAERLAEFARSTAIEEEIDYWTSRVSQPHAKLRGDQWGSNSVASRRTVSVSLTADETRVILQELPTKHRTQINEVLLAALARTFTAWTGTSSFLVDLEGHGREHLFEDVDLARTVGWFTTIFPVSLDLGNSSTPVAALRAVKEQLRAIPNRGIGYGMLRYLSRNSEVADRMSQSPQAEVRFNYLGQRDTLLASSNMFAPPWSAVPWHRFGQSGGKPPHSKEALETGGEAQSPKAERGYLLNVISSVTNGQLRFDWSYSENIHARKTIESLAETCLTELRALLADTRTAATVYAPSDFPNAKISESDLNTILAKLRT
jgi:amino acid adenylation domain-containing protein/non-ribosomal peptide synthase protein (TIGR01720 family)